MDSSVLVSSSRLGLLTEGLFIDDQRIINPTGNNDFHETPSEILVSDDPWLPHRC